MNFFSSITLEMFCPLCIYETFLFSLPFPKRRRKHVTSQIQTRRCVQFMYGDVEWYIVCVIVKLFSPMVKLLMFSLGRY